VVEVEVAPHDEKSWQQNPSQEVILFKGTLYKLILASFNSIPIDLGNLDVKIEEEHKAILLVVSLPPSCKPFKEVLLYSNNATLSFEDAKSNLLSKEKVDLEVCSNDKAESLSVRRRSSKKGNNGKKIPYQNSENVKSTKTYNFCKKSGI